MNRATSGAPPYDRGSRPAGLGPTDLAVTSTPARFSASIRAVRPKVFGSRMSDTRRTGSESAAMVPESLMRVPSAEDLTVMSVGLPASTVRTVDDTAYGATRGRQSSRAAHPDRRRRW